eukprot:TRINITY_DN3277_c0_g1_i2.p1 TRINITY_DN3277_c0_g1~~TRINITY_DN3277_c0_g1_i2.p1  ORF type:complete len:287 (+),score=67.20 TRINITY_DN3277_c0_g1_i2:127-987(+)
MSAGTAVPYAPTHFSIDPTHLLSPSCGVRSSQEILFLETSLHRALSISEGRRSLSESSSGIVGSPAAYSRLHLKASVGDDLSDEDMAQVNHTDADGNGALIWAATHGQADVVRKLLENGAYVNAQNRRGESALQIAARAGFEQVCAVLLQFKASPELTDLDGATAAHMAAAEGRVAVLNLLRLYRADFNAQDDEGDTPVHYAARANQMDAVQYLVQQCGARPDIANDDMETPLALAASSGSVPPLVEFLHKSTEFSNSNSESEDGAAPDYARDAKPVLSSEGMIFN